MRLGALVRVGVVGLVLQGCAGCEPSEPAAPTGLRVEGTSSFDLIRLLWDAPPEDIDGFELEGRLGGEPWQQLHEDLIPVDVAGIELTLGADMPELVTLSFRLRAVRDGRRSPYGAEATWRRTIRPPELSMSYGWGSGVQLSWVNRSAVADALRLERTAMLEGAALGPFEVLPVSFPETSWVDTAAWSDCVQLAYRLTYSKGADASAPLTPISGSALPLAPLSLQVTTSADSASLSWVYASTHHASAAVLRGDGVHAGYNSTSPVEIATLDKGATSFVDAGLAPGGYTYVVQARCGDGAAGTSAGALTATWAPLDAAVLRMPSGGMVARDGSGGWFIVRRWMSDTGEFDFRLHQPVALGWETYQRTHDGKPLVLLLDAADRPHLVYGAPPTEAGAEIRHDWQEADGWHTETAVPANAGDMGCAMAAALGTDGALHVVVQVAPEVLRHHWNAGGTWQMETLSPLALAGHTSNCQGAELRVEGDRLVLLLGDSHIYAHANRLALLWRSGAGVWSESVVPVGAATPWLGHMRLFTAPGAEEVLFEEWVQETQSRNWWTVRREGGTWGAPQLVPQPYGDEGRIAASAASGDLSRVAIAVAGWEAQVHVRDAGGWSTLPIYPTWFYGLHAEFTASGKLVVLDGLAEDQSGPTNYLLYQER